MISHNLLHAIDHLKKGHIIAYPTEAVYGLGCDPFQESAVLRLLQLKNREVGRGLILIASSWDQIATLIQPLPKERLDTVRASWPGPTTWVFPATERVPRWIRGQHESVAIRITNHPIALALCEGLQCTLVSTSANLTGQPPLKTAQAVEAYFDQQIDYVVTGEVGPLAKPTPIRDALTGQLYRE